MDKDEYEVINQIAEKRSKEIASKYPNPLENKEAIKIGFTQGMIETLYLCSKIKNSA
jgi:hypothetical protein